jgi:hypothetical protein
MPNRQAIAYYLRKRVRAMRTVVSSMFRTHTFAPGTTGIDTSVFADRSRPVTFQFKLKRTGATASGDIIVLGSASNRFQVSVSDDDLSVIAGGTGSELAAALVSGALPAQDQVFDVSIWAEPGTGRLSVWVNGQLRGKDTAEAGSFGQWADEDASGVVGASLVNLELAGLLSACDGQGPRRRKN